MGGDGTTGPGWIRTNHGTNPRELATPGSSVLPKPDEADQQDREDAEGDRGVEAITLEGKSHH